MEALNAASAFDLPLVAVIVNNQWAISVPRSKQNHAKTLAQKGIAAGIPAVQVDGNDLIASRWAMEEALERARSGKGPSLIEMVTYRLSDHTTADDARRYRDEEEVELEVVAVDDEAVTVDLNHPYAGKRLRFVGRVVEID